MKKSNVIIEELIDEGRTCFQDLDQYEKNILVSELIKEEESSNVTWSISDSCNLNEIMIKFSDVLSADWSERCHKIEKLLAMMCKGASDCYSIEIDHLFDYYSAASSRSAVSFRSLDDIE